MIIMVMIMMMMVVLEFVCDYHGGDDDVCGDCDCVLWW